MGYVVVRRGEESEKDYRDYLLLVSRRLLQRGEGLDRVPRVRTDGAASHWRYVSADEAEARSLAEELRTYTEDEGWSVELTKVVPTIGPLQPLTVDYSRTFAGLGFSFDPISAAAIRLRYPGSVRHRSTWIKTDLAEQDLSADELRLLAVQLLPILAGIPLEKLGVFGGFEIVDPVTEAVVLPVTLLAAPVVAEETSAETPRHSDNAASLDHCTAPTAR